MSVKYELIDVEKAYHSVVDMCAWLSVSKSGFYDWRSRPMSATAERRERLKLMTAAWAPPEPTSSAMSGCRLPTSENHASRKLTPV